MCCLLSKRAKCSNLGLRSRIERRVCRGANEGPQEEEALDLYISAMFLQGLARPDHETLWKKKKKREGGRKGGRQCD